MRSLEGPVRSSAATDGQGGSAAVPCNGDIIMIHGITVADYIIGELDAALARASTSATRLYNGFFKKGLSPGSINVKLGKRLARRGRRTGTVKSNL
jgi:hypothetical protein